MANLIFQSEMTNFNGLTIDGNWPNNYDDPWCDDYFTFSDPLGGNNVAMRLQVEGSERGCAYDNEPKHRAQVNPSVVRISNNSSVVWWGGYRMFLPSSQRTVYQWLNSNNKQISHASFSLRYNVIYLTGTSNINNIQFRWHNDYGSTQGGEQTTRSCTISNAFDRWIGIVWKLYQRLDNTGFGSLWIDGEKLINFSGVQTGGTWGCDNCISKMGIYWGSDLRPYLAEMYLDDWKMGTTTTSENESIGYNMVAPLDSPGVLIAEANGPYDAEIDENIQFSSAGSIDQS